MAILTETMNIIAFKKFFAATYKNYSIKNYFRYCSVKETSASKSDLILDPVSFFSTIGGDSKQFGRKIEVSRRTKCIGVLPERKTFLTF